MRVWIWMLVLVGGAAAAQDLTLVRAQRVITMDPARPFATAFAFDGSGKLVAVGEGDELAKVHPQAVTLDLGDATVVPGLIDAHGHVPGLGLTLSIADLTGTRSKAEIVERLKAFEARLAKDA
ncbi:MAG TPA: amidohydrolase, partial [Pseudomonadota bacterium]|nr:amidohydrolase [Pseudomonadota bacterium]